MAESIQGVPQLQARLRAITPQQSGSKLMQTLALTTVRNAKRLVPRKTGNLGRTIHVKSFSVNSAVVEASANYAAAVEYGTRPHVIVPRNRKALRFAKDASGRRLTGSPRKGAAVVFARRVHHPGTKAQPYLRPGAQQAIEDTSAKDIIVAQWNGAA